MSLDEIDRRILNQLQDGFPIGPAPFRTAAEALDITEADLLARLERLKSDRIITRFGPFFDAEAMGGAFCLCAMAVPEDEFDAVVEQVNARPEVAHNYQRTHKLNMWFVIAAESKEEIEAVGKALEEQTGYRVLLFPKLQEFFIGFRVAA